MAATRLVVETNGSRRDLVLGGAGSQNPLDGDLLDELLVRLREAWSDPSVRVIVLRSASERAFSAGADLKELARLDADGARASLRRGQEVFAAIEASPKPVVSVVDGVALGGGLELCLATSLTIASDRARFGLPEARLGLIPGYGGTQRLTRAVGRQRALRVMLVGDLLPASELYELGALAVPPVAPAELESRTDTIVAAMLTNGPAALASILTATRAAQAGAPATGFELETHLAIEARVHGDGEEGVQAFLDKRDPSFPGLASAVVPDAWRGEGS